MDTNQINYILLQYKNYLGTFPCDKIEVPLKLPAAMVVNTHPNGRPGEHWVAICINENNIGEYFDPYGIPPTKKIIKKYLNTICDDWDFYKTTIQSLEPDSKACGEICIIYISSKFSGKSTNDIQEIFRVPDLNDFIATFMVDAYFRLENDSSKF